MQHTLRQIPERSRRFFVLARWGVLLVAPFLIGLSSFQSKPMNWLLLIYFAVLTVFFHIRLKQNRTTHDVAWYTTALASDLILVTAIVVLRDGLRTDAYLLYILVINEAGLMLGIVPALVAGVASVLLYSCAIWLFADPDPTRLLIRAVYMNLIGAMTAFMASSEKKALMDSVLDFKTQLPNYRRFTEVLREAVGVHRDQRRYLSLAMIDVDDFKAINHSIGHVYADRVLQQLATLLQAHTRPTDFLARFGGEEFLVLLTDTDANQAVRALNRLCDVVSGHTFSPAPGVSVRLTISVGVSSLRVRDTSTDLQNRADRALRDAKNAGKHCVRLEAVPPPTLGRY